MIQQSTPHLTVSKNVSIWLGVVLSIAWWPSITTATMLLQSEESQTQTKSSHQLRDVVQQAFTETHAGWSSDEVILRDDLNQAYLKNCQKQMPNVSAADFNWALMNMRKAGKLDSKTTKRARVASDDVAHLAEIAARTMQDRHQVSSDRVMADPKLRTEFDQIAAALMRPTPVKSELNNQVKDRPSKQSAPDELAKDQSAIDQSAKESAKNQPSSHSAAATPESKPETQQTAYRIRRAAFTLRKTRKLKPELITRIADWGRTVTIYGADEITASPEQIPEHPGVYIFRDTTGYLYIGQTENLRERLITHLDQSHNQSLAKYLKDQGAGKISIEVHAFDPKSRAKQTMIRRAYESELIRSRKPRFNIQP